jgi:hypothetical protein
MQEPKNRAAKILYRDRVAAKIMVNGLKTIIVLFKDSNTARIKHYDDDGRLVDEKELNNIKLIVLQRPALAPTGLIKGINVYVIDGKPEIETRGAALFVK